MLASLLARHAQERPEERAVVSDVRVLTWRELHERTERLAAGLAARGVEAGEPVALVLPNGPAFVAGFLALARLGAVALPLAAESKAKEVRSALDASGCRTLLADGRLAGLCRDLLGDASLLRAFVSGVGDEGVPSLRSLADAGQRPACPLPPEGADLLEQLTSGTTGPRKRIVRTHTQLLREAAAFAATVGTSPEDRILGVVPLSHAHGLGNALLASLHAGAALVLQERFDRRATLRLLARERITLFPAVPFLVSILADTRTREPVDLSALRLCFTAGSPLRRETWSKARERLGISLRQLYGSTETGALTLNLDADAEATLESVGRPLEGVRVAILDEAGAVLPSGSEGQVAVRSPGAAEHSLGPRGRTPLAGPGGWLRMGDLGRLDAEGRLHLGGRTALVINVAGRKVNPAEIESVLLGHPKIREAVVVGVRDPYGEEAVKAVIVPREPCTRDEVLARCREGLADYKVPRLVEFRSAIPRCPAGKVLRNELMEPSCAS